MKRTYERILWMAALCVAVGMWTAIGAQNPGGRAQIAAFKVPPPGVDDFDSIGGVVIAPAGQGAPQGITSLQEQEIHAVGPTMVQRFPAEGETIPTEILSMDLTGFHPELQDFRVREAANRPSRGAINRRTGQSFFDVFFEIDLPEFKLVLHNEQPARLQARINAIPPINIAYRPPQIIQIPLLDPQGRVVAVLFHVQHVPVTPTDAKIKRELIRIERKLDFLLRRP